MIARLPRAVLTIALLAIALVPAASSQARLGGFFEQLEDDITLTDPDTFDPITADVYAFRVANNSGSDISSLDLSFTGDFINGTFSTLTSPALPVLGPFTVAETFFPGNGVDAPTIVPATLIDDGTTLAGEGGILGGVWVPDRTIRTVAVFTLPSDAEPMTFATNVNPPISAVLDGNFVDLGGFGSLPPLPGDANRDCFVDLLDFDILASNFGAGPGAAGGFSIGDFNVDGAVDLLDFDLLALNFAPPLSTDIVPTPAAVPEPATAALLGLGGVAALARRRRS
ncbi:MAG: PEP-CTERM sorting domain-containing protein [Planctomycetota bacterium]